MKMILGRRFYTRAEIQVLLGPPGEPVSKDKAWKFIRDNGLDRTRDRDGYLVRVDEFEAAVVKVYGPPDPLGRPLPQLVEAAA